MTPTPQTEAGRLADDLTFHGRYGMETEDQAKLRRLKRNADAAAELRRLDAIEADNQQLRKALERVHALGHCGSVDSWMALSDEQKRDWFAVTVNRDSHQRRTIKELEAERDQLRAQVERLQSDLQGERTRFTNLSLDIHRLLNWEKPLNNFDEAKVIQKYLDEIATPEQVERLQGGEEFPPRILTLIREAETHLQDSRGVPLKNAAKAALAWIAARSSAQPAASARCRLCDCTGDIHDATGEWRGQCPRCTPVSPAPCRPDVLERLSYHVLERDDLTLDECWDVLATGWAKVRGRTERHMVMQIMELLAGQPASPARVPLTDERITEEAFLVHGHAQGEPGSIMFRHGVRFAERFNGIGQPVGGEGDSPKGSKTKP